jgi:hypothetical protein
MPKSGRIRELLDLRVNAATQRRLANEYRKLSERLRSRTDLLTLALLNVWDKLAQTEEFKGKIDAQKLEELRDARDPRPMLVELLTDVVMLELDKIEKELVAEDKMRAKPSKNGDES